MLIYDKYRFNIHNENVFHNFGVINKKKKSSKKRKIHNK